MLLRNYSYLSFKAVLMLLPFFFVENVTAQEQHILDSLKRIINTAKDAKAKIDALNACAFEYRVGNIDSGKLLTRQAYRLSKEINYHTGVGDYYDCMCGLYLYEYPDSSIFFCRKAIEEYVIDHNSEGITQQHANLGTIFLLKGKYDSSVFYTRKALAAIDNNKQLDKVKAEHKKMWLYQGLGNLFYYMSYYDSSIIYAQRSLAIAEREKDKSAQSANLIIIANVYEQQDDHDKAITYQEKAAVLELAANDYKGYILCLTNIASYSSSLKNYEKAKRYADSAVREGVRRRFNKYMSHNYQTYGDIEMALHHFDKALKYYDTGLQYCRHYASDFVECGLLRSLGDAYLCTGNAAKGRDYFLLSLQKCEDDRESMQLAYSGLSDAYEQLGNHKEALKYARLSAALRDSIFNRDTKETINSLNIKYETVKKEQQIQLLSKDNDLKDVLTQKQKQQKYFAYVAFIGLLSFGGYSFHRYRRQKRIEYEQALLKERLRLGRDLHDDIGATLSSISVYSTAVKQRLKDGSINEAERMLDTMSEDAREMVTNMGDMVWMINPQNTTVEKLLDRVHQFASNVLTAKNISFHFYVDESLKQLDLNIDARKNIFLIVKEALNNAVKYAVCTDINLSVERMSDNLVLKIEDNGKGFDINKQRCGNGLSNMKQRAEELKGLFEMGSVPGEGTRYQFLFHIPIIGD